MTDLDVLVIGRNCLDVVSAIEIYPLENQKVPLDFTIKEGGGQGGTSACCISKLGGRVACVGKLGDDAEGRFCLERLEAFGVDTAHMHRVPLGKTPTAYIFVTRSTGRRTIIYEPNLLPKLKMADIRSALAHRPGVLLLDPDVTYLADTLEPVVQNRAKVVYDCERWRNGMEGMMAFADYFIPTADFLHADQLAVQGLPFLRKLQTLKTRVNGQLIVTRGEHGAYYFADDRLYRVPAPSVPVLDTTGAGDNFHAAFALAVSQGADIHDAVRFSVAVASLSCRKYGGRAGIPDPQEAERLAEGLETIRL